MKVLLAHNYYSSSAPSGENAVFEAESALLRQNGQKVVEATLSSDDLAKRGVIGLAQAAACANWNPMFARRVKNIVVRESIDVVHAHNTFPLISPAIFSAVRGHAARVMTLHNFRIFCAGGTPLRNGNICTECIDTRSVKAAMKHGCYRGSRLATWPVATSIAFHRWLGTWQNEVDAFIALTEFQRDKMISAGLPAEKVHVKSNFHLETGVAQSNKNRTNSAIFVGRLSKEKGLHTLIEAWKLMGNDGPRLKLVGDGPLKSNLENAAAGLPIKFLGQISRDETLQQIATARLLILPSECYEGFPLVLAEAFALNTPVIVSNVGALPSLVRYGKNGLVFEGSNAVSLAGTVSRVWQDAKTLTTLSKNAWKNYQDEYRQSKNYQTLINIYETAIRRGRRVRK